MMHGPTNIKESLHISYHQISKRGILLISIQFNIICQIYYYRQAQYDTTADFKLVEF